MSLAELPLVLMQWLVWTDPYFWSHFQPAVGLLSIEKLQYGGLLNRLPELTPWRYCRVIMPSLQRKTNCQAVEHPFSKSLISETGPNHSLHKPEGQKYITSNSEGENIHATSADWPQRKVGGSVLKLGRASTEILWRHMSCEECKSVTKFWGSPNHVIQTRKTHSQAEVLMFPCLKLFEIYLNLKPKSDSHTTWTIQCIQTYPLWESTG